MVSLVIKNLCFWIVSLSQAEKCVIKRILKYKSVKNSLARRTSKIHPLFYFNITYCTSDPLPDFVVTLSHD